MGLRIVLAPVLVATAMSAEAARYKGERINIYTGQREGRWIVRTKPQGATLRTTIVCKPRRVCGDFKRLELTLTPDSTTGYTGSFRVGGGLVRCTLEASVYAREFEGVYTCEDGQQGPISGRER